jgi:lysozyme family protein
MSDVKQAIDFVLRQEDSILAGKVVDLRDGAGWTRFGITSKFHPELIASGFFDESKVNRDEALAIAERVYSASYAAPLYIGEIKDQRVATAVLSFGINSGSKNAAILLQRAIIEAHRRVTVDGIIGPATIAACNACDPDNLLTAYTVLAKLFYHDLAADKPSNEKFLRGWNNRADAWAKAA